MHQKNKDILLPLSLFLITIITRIPFTSKILSHWDSVSFALATERYDVTIHQPHPPGYFLYVMSGKLLNLFTHDANTSFVIMSVVASGLTVSFVFVLANRMYDRMTAFWSSVLAITSPLFWFYSEVALTYMLEAFFSIIFVYLCWRILNGEHRLIFLSSLVLALAGGIRQSTLVFLIPLWLYSIRKSPYTYILISFAVLAGSVLSWFLPMISMTGGYTKYKAAVDEFWTFNFEPYIVVRTSLKEFISYVMKFMIMIIQFIIYGLSLCTAFMAIFITKIDFLYIKKELLSGKSIFIAFWIIPYILALFFFFMPAANPGYSLIFMPALLLVTVRTIKSITDRANFPSKLFITLMFLTVIFNFYTFLCSGSPMSIDKLKRKNVYVLNFMNAMRNNFSPADTVILSRDYLFAGPRHFMYYLPEYKVYIIDQRIDVRGRKRKVFWGQNHNAFISETAHIPKGIKYFVSPLHDNIFLSEIKKTGGIINTLSENGKNIAFYGDISIAPKAYSGVKFEIEK